MKISYKTNIVIDRDKYPNLTEKEIRAEIKASLDSIITSMENDGYELHYLKDLNAERGLQEDN